MNRKNLISAGVLLVLVALTVSAILKGNDMEAVVAAMRKLHPAYLLAAAATAIFFVSAEGLMICYLLRSLNYGTKAATCVKYSFVGFFFSGITPSATGGQPMQLYYMQKEGHKVSDSTVVLMTVAVIYKFVLVVMGVGILIFYHEPLAVYLKQYLYLYYLGLFLNTALVVILLFIMVSPKCFKGIVIGGEKILKKFRLLKSSRERTEKLIDMADQYHEAVLFFLKNKSKIAAVIAFTVVQRCSVFFLTWLIYRGLGLEGTSAFTVMSLQAAIYIAVDMLPLPGAQGITEMMYKTAFSMIFPGAYLTASMCVTRGLNFYMVLILSAVVALWCHLRSGKAGSVAAELS
ncbi:MAG: flippase-like domain-containing protein [Lachnospiraceae bacterium]|nr:flippase-like domain-containing protein [Lachnospiraceae bacterium]